MNLSLLILIPLITALAILFVQRIEAGENGLHLLALLLQLIFAFVLLYFLLA